MDFQNTRLWKDAFSERKNDEYAGHRKRLSGQLLAMRERVRELISFIPADCKDLTVHDVTHLDALWVAAQQVAGDRWVLNPAETFVFGAAVLIHDAGLTTLAYPNGRLGLKGTPIWTDLEAALIASKSLSERTSRDLSPQEEATVLFAVLRELHASQAATLCTQSWNASGTGPQYLIEDSELRESYGETIGRIASSHHWAAEQLRSDLRTHLGGSASLPDWAVNETKIACLLRCADAAQVDRTRAPLFLYAAVDPQGYSAQHWRAQSKLNRPTLKKDAIHFTSSSAFSNADANAWWIAYDLAKVLDRELRASNAILTDLDIDTFPAQRVAGAESPGSFSKYVHTREWRPIDASIRVTDPLRLARTLGGKNLYGASSLVPFREMIQNSADAIRARRALETRGQDFGRISVTVEAHPERDDDCLIHVDDNGTGMSEKVLTTTLVDFGRSFWSSNLMREEFPGLQSAKVKHIGKFGIGFFSLFEITRDVRVTSRRYDGGVKDTRTLEFRDLVTRPLLHDASASFLPPDVCTRVSITVPKRVIERVSSVDEELLEASDFTFIHRHHGGQHSFKEAIQGMVCFLDIDVQFTDRRNGDQFFHTAGIYEKHADEFVRELPGSDRDKSAKHFRPANTLRAILSATGDAYGRATLDVDRILEKHSSNRGHISVGGIVSPSRGRGLGSGTGEIIPFFGVVEGKTERAARDIASVIAPIEAVDNWLMDQLKLLEADVFRKSELMNISSFALRATKSDSGLPYAFNEGGLKTVSEMVDLALKVDEFNVPVIWRYDTWLEVVGYDSLRPEFFEAALTRETVVLSEGSERMLDEEDARAMRKDGGGELDRDGLFRKWGASRSFIELVEEVWKGRPVLQLTKRKIFSTKIVSLSGERWVISIAKSHRGP